MKTKPLYVIASSYIVAGLVLGWVMWPTIVVSSLHFVEKKGEEPSRRACDRVVGVGPRAVPAIIRSIKRNSPWVRVHCYLPIALGKLGQPARDSLLEAIDSETNPKIRAFLISSLQSGLSDFSRFDIWFEDAKAGRVSELALLRFAGDVQNGLKGAPGLLEERKLNPAFVQWWETHKDQYSGSGPAASVDRGRAPPSKP
jgi:hypothetical protein